MKLGWTLLVVGAFLFVISEFVGDDSQISDIANMDEGEIRRSATEVANMSGFSDDSELGLLPREAESDRLDEPLRETSRMKRQPSSEVGSVSSGPPGRPRLPAMQRAEASLQTTDKPQPVRRDDVPAPAWDIPDNTPVQVAVPTPPRYAASRTGAFKVEKLDVRKAAGED